MVADAQSKLVTRWFQNADTTVNGKLIIIFCKGIHDLPRRETEAMKTSGEYTLDMIFSF